MSNGIQHKLKGQRSHPAQATTLDYFNFMK